MDLVTHGDIERLAPPKKEQATGSKFCGVMLVVDCAWATEVEHYYWNGIGYPCDLVRGHAGDHWSRELGWYSRDGLDLRTRVVE